MRAPTPKDRFADAQKLLDYGFNNYSYTKFANKGDILKSVDVAKGVKTSLNIVYETDSGCLLEKGSNKNIEQIINIPDNVFAPIQKGQKIGDISYTLNNETLCSVSLIADEDIKKINLSSMFEKIFFNWFRLLRS